MRDRALLQAPMIVLPGPDARTARHGHDPRLAAVIALPEIADRLTTLGFTPLTTTPEEFAARIRSEMEKWDRVIREAKISIQN